MSSWVGIKTAQNVNVHIFEDATIQIDINLWPKPCSEVVFTTRKLRPMTSINYITKIKNTNSMKTNRRFKLLYIKWPLCSGFIPDVSTAVNSLTHSINLINKKIDQTNTNEDSSKFKSCVQQAYKRIWELPPLRLYAELSCSKRWCAGFCHQVKQNKTAPQTPARSWCEDEGKEDAEDKRRPASSKQFMCWHL